MKRTLIVPATIALLTGMAATAQETNESAAEINTSAAIEAEADVNTDEMSVEELNALQLDVLESSDTTEASEEQIFTAQADTDTMTADADRKHPTGDTKSHEWDKADMDKQVTAEADLEADTEMGMGGPDYASETDAMTDTAMQGTIAQLASEDARFTTLVALVEQAGLNEKLDADGEYTVFAPTNAAFEKLDPELVTKLKSGEANDTLKSILKTHVVEGETMSSALVEGDNTVATMADADLIVRKTGDSVTIGNATVVAADIDASNGVIHAVDTVIIPVDLDLTDEEETES